MSAQEQKTNPRHPPLSLVAGVSGFLGSHLADRLLSEGHIVVGLDNLCTGSLENLKNAFLDKDKFIFHQADITKKFDLPDLKYHYIWHLASPASPVDYRRLSIETMFVNSTGTKNLLEVAVKHNAKFLLASTSEAYGNPLVHPQPETYWGNVNPTGNRSCYDESKRFAEALTLEYHRRHKLDARIIRIFNTYGPRMRINDGRVVPNFICQALSGEPLTVYGNGLQTRSLIFVADEIEGIFRAMIYQKTNGEVINIGNPNEYTILEFAGIVAGLCGVELNVTHKPLPPDDPAKRCPDISKARALLGWEPSVDLVHGISMTIEYFTGKLKAPCKPSPIKKLEAPKKLYRGLQSMSQPLVSVIINNYNYGHFLGEAIESALNQTYQHIEIIVVDDGSTDISREVISTYGGRVITVLKSNGGQASAFNAGFSASAGDIICFLDSDDLFLPDKVETMVKTHQLYPNAVLYYHQMHIVDSQGVPKCRPWPSTLWVGLIRERVEKSGGWWPRPTTSALCFARKYLEKVLPMPEDGFRLCADAYIGDLAPYLGMVAGVSKALTLYRQHGQNYWGRLITGDSKGLRRRAKQYEFEHIELKKALSKMGVPTFISLNRHLPYLITNYALEQETSIVKMTLSILFCHSLSYKDRIKQLAKLVLKRF